jgi:hypothetical protein
MRLVASVRGSGSAPMMAASSGLGFKAFMKALLFWELDSAK